jgi:Flp pilus assembly pilin Flp
LIVAQTQIGQNINGEAAIDFFGENVSISSNGNIIAVGSDSNDDNGSNSGHVRVYENIGGDWTQIGQDIDGEAAEDGSGFNISISSNGNIVAIGAIYNDGNGPDSGHVRVYENIGGVWTQVGQDINGEAGNFDFFGWSVSLSSDGNIVAIGAIYNDGNGSNSGHVRVYENIGGVWTQVGQDIDGEAVYDLSGWSISTSSNGNIVAIGAGNNDVNGSNSGHVRVYENIGGVWTQVGQDIDGEAAGDFFGWSVSLSSDGSIIAIGANYSDGNGSNSGEVKVFQYIGGVWTQIGVDINGQAEDDFLGVSLNLSSNGSKLVVGASGNDDNGVNSGQVRVYDLSIVLSTESFKLDYFSIYPNPAQNIIKIELKQGIDLEKVNIYNTLGKFISTTNNLKINTSNLTRGIYFIEVETNKGKSAKKIVIE